MENQELLLQIQKDILEMKKVLQAKSQFPSVSDKWLPRSEVMRFLDYGDTQMGKFEKSDDLVITKVGKRIFILKALLEKLPKKI